MESHTVFRTDLVSPNTFCRSNFYSLDLLPDSGKTPNALHPDPNPRPKFFASPPLRLSSPQTPGWRKSNSQTQHTSTQSDTHMVQSLGVAANPTLLRSSFHPSASLPSRSSIRLSAFKWEPSKPTRSLISQVQLPTWRRRCAAPSGLDWRLLCQMRRSAITVSAPSISLSSLLPDANPLLLPDRTTLH